MKQILFLCLLMVMGLMTSTAQNTKGAKGKASTTSKKVMKKTSGSRTETKAIKKVADAAGMDKNVVFNKWAITDSVYPNELRTENISTTKVVTRQVKGTTYSKIDTVSVDTIYSKPETALAATESANGRSGSADTTYTAENNGVRTVTSVRTLNIRLQMDNRNDVAHLTSNRPLNRIVLKNSSGEVLKEIVLEGEKKYTITLSDLPKEEYILACYATNGQIRTFIVKINK